MTHSLTLRERGRIHDKLLGTRLNTVVPKIMERAGIDCWVLVAREYNEDPVVATMLPATWLNARRRTILVFTDFGRERIAIARYAVGEAFPPGWLAEEQPDQWRRVAEYLEEADPQRIALNLSATFALADGLAASDHAALLEALPAHLQQRIVLRHELALGWLETRTPEEMELYPEVCRRAHTILRRALSPEVIEAGVTTTEDVEWWLRQTVADAGYGTWFHPTVSVQRQLDGPAPESFVSRPAGATIDPGDLVHIDFGIVYLDLHTDQQQHGYVLEEGESDAPAGLQAGLAAANRVQDLLLAEFQTGRTGNEILAATLRHCAEEGLDAAIYTHPIGLHGHAAGPTIGLWDQQGGVAGGGDYPVHPDTAYSIELSATTPVTEWDGQVVRFMLEEEAFFDGQNIAFLDGRQTEIWLI
ncbi:MAG: M24 family metallopeptidase [Acidimicrobiia bacterium]|nr:M24 family metallopeptidase [Acidimicrobiia bacterium]